MKEEVSTCSFSFNQDRWFMKQKSQLSVHNVSCSFCSNCYTFYCSNADTMKDLEVTK